MNKKKLSTCLLTKILAAMVLVLAGLTSANAVTYLWNVASPGSGNWNVNANWSPSTANPGSADTVKFGFIGTNSTAVINNVVSVNTTITSLAYTNLAGWHVTQIPSGVTLTVSGGCTIGGFTNALESSSTAVGMVDAGTFYISGGNFIVGNAGNSAVQTLTADFSGLSNLVYNASSGIFNLCNSNRSQGTMTLAAASNNLTAATANIGTGSSSSTSATSFKLGSGTNLINISSINLSANRENGTISFFNSAGGIRIRGTGGTDTDRATMVLGNRNTGSSTGGTSKGQLSFNGHPVDAKLATVTLGTESSGANGGLIGSGVIQFDTGTIDATTINMAICSGSNSTNGASGNITVGANGTLIVGTGGMSLANNTVPQVTGGTGTTNTGCIGTLFLNGGTAICSNNIFKTTSIASTGVVAVASSGTLYLQGNKIILPDPADLLNVTNGNIELRVNAGSIFTNIVATTVNASGTTTFVIDQVSSVTGPTTFPLVSYSTLNGTVAGNFAVTYPGGYTASLVDNSAQKRIDLSITPNTIITPLVWTGATNNDWDLTTSNWTAAGALAVYSDPSATIFDDTASNSIVTLTAPFAPLSMTMSNSLLNYTFNGSGSIGNTNVLTLKGSATTILDNSGSNSFTGGTTISAGTLQIGNNDANGNLPDGQIVLDNSALVFDRTDSPTNNSIISGSGTLTQSGSGTLTLAGANSYTTTTISAGTLQVGAGGTSGSLGSGSVTDNSSLAFNRADNLTIANVILGSGSVTKVNNNILTLAGNNSYAGGLAANAGILRLSNTNSAGTGIITVNPGAIVVLATNNITNAVTLAGGTLAAGATQNPLKLELTAAPGTTSTLLIADPANLNAGDAFECAFTNAGTWHGSGNVIVASVTNDASADSGNGFRLRGLAASDFSGTLTLSNGVKGELQTTVAGPTQFSPAGTGTIALVCGNYLGNNTTTNATPGNAAYCEFNLRNLSTGNALLGNNVVILGSGFTTVDPLGSAPAGASVTMGNLTIGNGQELGVYLSAAPMHVVVFPTVSLTGGVIKFSPKTPTFGAAASVGSDLSLSNITETASSSVVMNGQRILYYIGNASYSGTTTVSNGTLEVDGSILGSGAVTVEAGATLDGAGVVDGPVTIAPDGIIAPGNATITTNATLTINNSLALAGTNIMNVNKTGAVFINNVITNVTTLSYGGTLQLNLTGAALAAGDAFKLYGCGSTTGTFTNIVPAAPGTGLLWSTNTLTNGVLSVVAAVNTTPTTITTIVAGNVLMLSWPTDHTGWYLQVQTNSLGAGLGTNWADVAGSSTTNQVNVSIDPGSPAVFYRMSLNP
jgi:autotransporter-associated beta strand protein